MKYILVENRTIIHLGPIDWKPRFIKSELDELEIDFFIPPVEQGYIKINNELELIPITSGDVAPAFDQNYESITGPYYTYFDFEVHTYYDILQQPIESIKANLKPSVTNERYIKEIAGTKVMIQNIEVTVDTARSNRDIFVQKYLLMGDTETVQWKFPEAWLTLTKVELGQVVAAGAIHVQNSFEWESLTCNEIDDANDIETLKAIIIVEPPIVNNNVGIM